MQEGAHQETFVKDILLVSRSGGNNLSVPSFMFQISCLLLKSLIKSVTKSLAAAGKNEAWCWQISCSKQKGLAQSCWERSCDPHQDHVGLTTMLLPWINPPRATCDALFSSPYFFSSHLPLVSRSILSSSWAQCSPAKVFPPPQLLPIKASCKKRENPFIHQANCPQRQVAPGPRLFCAKASHAGPTPCPPIHKKLFLYTEWPP